MGGIWKRMVAILAANKIVAAISGWGLWFLLDWLFNNILYPAVIYWLGPFWGGCIMTVLAAIICWVWLQQILASEKDWFALDEIRRIQEKLLSLPRGFFRHPVCAGLSLSLAYALVIIGADPVLIGLPYDPTVILSLLNYLRSLPYELVEYVIVFVGITVQTDSMIATLYFRESKGRTLSRRDKRIFFVTTILANVYWTVRSWIVVILISYGLKLWQWLEAHGISQMLEYFWQTRRIIESYDIPEKLYWLSELIRLLFLLLLG
jgi:hypothetical protein